MKKKANRKLLIAVLLVIAFFAAPILINLASARGVYVDETPEKDGKYLVFRSDFLYYVDLDRDIYLKVYASAAEGDAYRFVPIALGGPGVVVAGELDPLMVRYEFFDMCFVEDGTGELLASKELSPIAIVRAWLASFNAG